MKPEGRSADQIIANNRLQPSSWHFFQSKSWIDLAKRTSFSGPLHYAAFELRYGIEVLLFELLILFRKELNEAEYKKCLGSPNSMRKMLREKGNTYTKLTRFTEIIFSLDPKSPKLNYWKLNDLFNYWGIASEFLHFVGIQSETYESDERLFSAIARIEETISIFWEKSNQNAAIGLLRPESMSPISRTIWEDYLDEKIDDDSARERLNIVGPISLAQMRDLRNLGGLL